MKLNLKPLQVEGVKRIISQGSYGLFWRPGLGKTLTTLMAFSILKDKGYVNRLLILSTRRVVSDVWPKEIQKWMPELSFRVLTGATNAAKRTAMLKDNVDIYLVNNDLVSWLADKKNNPEVYRLIKKVDMLVVDESSKYKNPSTGRFRGLRKLLPNFTRRVILTGSPAPNGLMNLWSQMFILDGGESLGVRITQFRNRYFEPCGYMGYEYRLLPGAEEKIYEAISGKVMHAAKNTDELPPLEMYTIGVTLPEPAREKYAELEKEFYVELSSGVVTVANAAVKTGKLRQLTNGAVYGEDALSFERVTHEVHTAKIEALVELLEEMQGTPALICYEWEHDRERIREVIAKKFKVRDVPYIGGGVKDKEVSRLIDSWNSDEIPFLLVHANSVAHGLNMQEVKSSVIFFTVPWSLENHEQLYQRVWREGQKHTVHVYHLIVEETIDEAVMKTLNSKDRTQNRLLTALKENVYGRQEGGAETKVQGNPNSGRKTNRRRRKG